MRSARSRLWGAVLAVLAAGLGVLPFIGNDYLVATGLGLLMWLALTQSWCVLSKMTGYVSLGHVGLLRHGRLPRRRHLAALAARAGRARRRVARCAGRGRRSACRCCACAGRTS